MNTTEVTIKIEAVVTLIHDFPPGEEDSERYDKLLAAHVKANKTALRLKMDEALVTIGLDTRYTLGWLDDNVSYGVADVPAASVIELTVGR